MKLSYRYICFILLLLTPSLCYAERDSHFHTLAPVISYLNVAVEISSAFCLKQFFFPGDKNRTAFQVFNFVFAFIFYLVALRFLVEQKAYYGFEQLTASQCIGRFFFGMGIYSLLQWIVIAAMVINVMYVMKYHDK